MQHRENLGCAKSCIDTQKCIKWGRRKLRTHEIQPLHYLLLSLRDSKLSLLRCLVKSLGARDGARDGALEGARDGAREGALDGALEGALPLDNRDLAFDAVSSSSSGGGGSNLGARLGASEGSRCLSGRYVKVRMSLTVSASS